MAAITEKMTISDEVVNFPEAGSIILLRKNSPNSFQHKAAKTTVIVIRQIRSQALSATTVPTAPSKVVFFFNVETTPQRMTSPTLGNAKFARLPIVTPWYEGQKEDSGSIWESIIFHL